MGFFRKFMCHRRLRKRILENPSAIRDHTKIHLVLKTPFEVWYWAMNMLELKDVEAENIRTPQEVIRDAEGTVFEIIDTMAFILHHMGWKTVVVSGAINSQDLLYHPSEYFVLINYMGKYITLDDTYTVIGTNLKLVFNKFTSYMATDWTGEIPMFAILPKSGVPYRLSEQFNPGDMP